MFKPKLLKKLRATLFELWLPIPLLAFGCWGLSGIVMYAVLNRDSEALKYLPLESPSKPLLITVPLKVAPRAIFVKVDKNRGISQVKVQTKDFPMTEIIFEFSTTDTNQLEVEISKALGISKEEIKKLRS
ncbi:MAG: hypothetical protein KME29_04120 [Calothrix sp. FI2-JRJ7]|jgi:hypothetical protein|nr:hypothetical protein [Calothrix sp. FI2-JRJ7]